jgi:biopolymer transport protein TolR
MLVLLIVFMVAAPLLVTGIPVVMPDANAEALPTETEPLTVTIDDQGRVFVGTSRITSGLGATLLEHAGGDTNRLVFVRGDRSVDYDTLIQVLDDINFAGFTRFGLVTTDE